MALLIVADPKSAARWEQALRALEPALDVRCWQPGLCADDVEFVLCWEYPEGALLEFPQLKCVCSMGAGVDHILRDQRFPEQVSVVRLVDPSLVNSMYDYLQTIVNYYYRNIDVYRQQQARGAWRRLPPRPAEEYQLGIMGLGNLGAHAAQGFAAQGFGVSGWSRTPQVLDGVKTFSGEDQRQAFLASLDVLICLLPLTAATRGILCRETFAAMPRGARVINVGRGGHLVDEELIEALDSGQLAGACLDVFEPEPLPPEHAFWSRDELLLTPHISSMTDARSTAPQVLENYRRSTLGESLLNQVDMARGY
jgi:glyoxylate/hydroxypyruvate reductase A